MAHKPGSQSLVDFDSLFVYDGNMPDLIVKSRYKAIEHTSDRRWAVISITTPGDGRPLPEFSTENRVDILRLCFYDINDDAQTWDGKMPGYLFDVDRAKQILHFAKQNWDHIDEFLIHCDMGKSRSPAVAAALTYITYGRGSDTFWHKNYIPNSLVYKLIIEENFHIENLRSTII